MKDEREKFENDAGLGADEKMNADERRILDELGLFGESRRQFLGQIAAGGLGVLAIQNLVGQNAFAFGKIENAAAAAPVERREVSRSNRRWTNSLLS